MNSSSSFRLAICGGLLISYLALVLAATMWPTPLDQGYGAAIERLLAVLHRHGIPEWFGYDKLEFTANVGMFLPLGFLLALTLSRRAWWLSLLFVPLVSGIIESIQGQFLDQRFASLLDVFANTIGGYLGVAMAQTLRGVVHARDRLVVEEAWKVAPRT
jgi:glycopeptide antibiotics resistance protein